MALRCASMLYLLSVCAAHATFAAAPKDLLDLSDGGKNLKIHADHADVQVVKTEHGPALAVRVGHQGGDYPGAQVRAPEGTWDLSKYDAVEFDVAHTGASESAAVRIHGRVDNPGDWKKQPWNVNAVTLKPGDRKTLRVTFGESYGNPGYKLDPAKVSQVMVFAEKPKTQVTIHVLAIRAVGEATAPSADSDATPASTAPAGDGETAQLFDLDGVQLKPNSTQVTSSRQMTGVGTGLGVRIDAGDDGYPGLAIIPSPGSWNLSPYGHVQARVINTGDTPLHLSLRVDNAGDWKQNPWNTESKSIKPGESGTIKVIFGYAYGYKPSYKLDPSRVSQVLLFTGKLKSPASFLIESITAGGPAGEVPPVKPESVRVKPVNGYILGPGVPLDVEKQVQAGDGSQIQAEGTGFTLKLPGNKDSHVVTYKPVIGRWDLTHACEVRVTVTNAGTTPLMPGVQVTSDGKDATDTAFVQSPLAPGQTREIVATFMASTPWRGPQGDLTKEHLPGEKGTGSSFSSDKADAVKIIVKHDGDAAMRVESIQALATPMPTPDWLGQRPPVDGDWSLTLNENFDGDSIDLKVWRNEGPNWWGNKSKTHWSKDNLIVADGMARMHFEKKTGWHNDDPASGHQSDYAGGFMDTYGKWVQRYGYFEARMKLPTAPGLWPAFWLMPDRGVDAGEQWKRQDTAKGGMEFDIFEHLTRWGPYRYNIAMHWDGYQKNHRATGSQRIYLAPDKDGFITCGLLWLPGKAVFYGNGVEVARWEHDRISNVESCIIFTMPVGGWDNNALDDAQLPADFIIDYVRVWQRKDLTDAE